MVSVATGRCKPLKPNGNWSLLINFATTSPCKIQKVRIMLAKAASRLAVRYIASVATASMAPELCFTCISPAGIPDSSAQSATKSLSSSSGDTSRAKVVSGRSLGAQKTVTSIVFQGRITRQIRWNRMRLLFS